MKMNKTTQLFIKFGKKIDKALGVLALILIGIILGYAWAWYALN
jgi:tetrahydromethanopterin S-methyltransferase subunit G